MPGSLEAPLARALHKWAEDDWEWGLDYHTEEANRCEENTPRILASLRSDPAVTAALAEALHDIGPEPLLGLPDVCNLWPEHERQADAILDALLGPRESAGGMEPWARPTTRTTS